MKQQKKIDTKFGWHNSDTNSCSMNEGTQQQQKAFDKRWPYYKWCLICVYDGVVQNITIILIYTEMMVNKHTYNVKMFIGPE